MDQRSSRTHHPTVHHTRHTDQARLPQPHDLQAPARLLECMGGDNELAVKVGRIPVARRLRSPAAALSALRSLLLRNLLAEGPRWDIICRSMSLGHAMWRAQRLRCWQHDSLTNTSNVNDRKKGVVGLGTDEERAWVPGAAGGGLESEGRSRAKAHAPYALEPVVVGDSRIP